MRQRHAPPPAHPFNIYIFKQHTPLTRKRYTTAREGSNLTDDESNTRVRRDHSTVNQTVPGATLYGEVELYVNRTNTAFATGSKNLREVCPIS